MAGSVAQIFWTALISYPYFWILMKNKRLRVSALYEIIGLDILMHEEGDKLDYLPPISHQILKHQ